MRTVLRIVICLWIMLAWASGLVVPGERAPIVVSPAQELAWGEEALRAFLLERPESPDRALVERVRRVGQRLASVTDRPTLLYSFLVVRSIDDKDLQAFSFPGGTVCLTESLARFYTSEDELAFALGHEIAHTVLRHHVSQARVQGALEAGAPGAKALLDAVRGAFALDTEMEADRFGALYAVRAGFSYTATYEAHERLGKALHGPGSHPEILKRVEALRGFRDELELSLEAFEAGVAALAGEEAGRGRGEAQVFRCRVPEQRGGPGQPGYGLSRPGPAQGGNPIGTIRGSSPSSRAGRPGALAGRREGPGKRP
jgi:Zn-dependent protease with chaperone function